MTDGQTSRVADAASPELDDVLAEYVRAAEAGTSVDREALLRRHPHLREELQSFFANRDEMERFAAPMRSTIRTWLPAPQPGVNVHYFGDYELMEQIAQGGMGVVYKARQISLDRVVALKMILNPAHDPQRFRAEAEAAASLDHPHIVPIYEIGRHEDRPYFTMRYLDGGSLSGRIAAGPIAPRDAATLMLPLVRAVHFAHQHGILHRDLKPGNVLLDKDGQPFVTDFGLAKQSHRDQELTKTGAVLGTPSYMAPEQAAGESWDWTTATDVYGLGTVLYAMLTGRAPFVNDSTLETLRQVRDCAPERPSRVAGGIPADLETICLKCLEKETVGRYGSAEALAEDLERFLRDEPVHARPATHVERTWRWCRRNPIVAGLTATVAIVLAASSVGGTWLAIQEHQARTESETSHGREEVAKNAAIAALGEAEAARRAAETALSETFASHGVSAAARQDTAEALLWFTAAAAAAEQSATDRQFHLLRAAAFSSGVPEVVCAIPNVDPRQRNLRFHPAGRYLLGRSVRGEIVVWDLQQGVRWPRWRVLGGEICAAWSPRGDQLAVGGRGGEVGLYDLTDGRLRTLFRLAEPVRELAYSGDGRRLAAGGNTARVWDVKSGARVADAISHPAPINGLILTRVGDRLITSCDDRFARVFVLGDTPAPSRLAFDPLPHECLPDSSSSLFRPFFPALLDEGQFLLTTPRRTSLTCVDMATGATVWRQQVGSSVYALAAADNGAHFVTGSDQGARVRDARGKRQPLLTHRHVVNTVAMSLDGRHFATGGWDRAVHIWSIDNATPLCHLPHQVVVQHVEFSPDGRHVATIQMDGLLRLWRLPLEDDRARKLPLDGRMSLVAIHPDGRHVAPRGTSFNLGNLKSTQVYDATTGVAAGPPLSTGGVIVDAAFSSDGQTLATAVTTSRPAAKATSLKGSAGHVCFWNWKEGKLLGEISELPAEPRSLAFQPRGQWLAVLCTDGQIQMIDAGTRSIAGAIAAGRPHRASNLYISNGLIRFAPDGQRLVLANVGRDVRVFDVAIRKLCYEPLAHDGICHDVDFSSDGQQLATSSLEDYHARVWDLATGKLLAAIPHPEMVFRARFSRDGTQLLTACRDTQARLFDWQSGRLVAPPYVHEEEIYDVRFTPDGRWVLTASRDDTVRVWDRRTAKLMRPQINIGGAAWEIAITPDGRRAVVGGISNSLHVVDLTDLSPSQPPNAARLALLGELSSGRSITHGAAANLTTDEWLARWSMHVRHLPVDGSPLAAPPQITFTPPQRSWRLVVWPLLEKFDAFRGQLNDWLRQNLQSFSPRLSLS